MQLHAIQIVRIMIPCIIQCMEPLNKHIGMGSIQIQLRGFVLCRELYRLSSFLKFKMHYRKNMQFLGSKVNCREVYYIVSLSQRVPGLYQRLHCNCINSFFYRRRVIISYNVSYFTTEKPEFRTSKMKFSSAYVN